MFFCCNGSRIPREARDWKTFFGFWRDFQKGKQRTTKMHFYIDTLQIIYFDMDGSPFPCFSIFFYSFLIGARRVENVEFNIWARQLGAKSKCSLL